MELRTGKTNRRRSSGKHYAEAFVIHEEKRFVLFDGTSDGCRPLIRVNKLPGNAIGIVEKIVGVHDATVPVIFGVAMKGVCAGPGDVIDVGAGQLPELS